MKEGIKDIKKFTINVNRKTNVNGLLLKNTVN